VCAEASVARERPDTSSDEAAGSGVGASSVPDAADAALSTASGGGVGPAGGSSVEGVASVEEPA
jgi:hypothetical protein